MNSLEQFKEDMRWTMLELTDEELNELYGNVADDIYASIEEIEAEHDYEDIIATSDVNLYSVVEAFEEVIKSGRMRFIDFYYLKEDEMYAALMIYDS